MADEVKPRPEKEKRLSVESATKFKKGAVVSLPSQEGGMAKVIELVEELLFRVEELEGKLKK